VSKSTTVSDIIDISPKVKEMRWNSISSASFWLPLL
jgi:hypothetical protein